MFFTVNVFLRDSSWDTNHFVFHICSLLSPDKWNSMLNFLALVSASNIHWSNTHSGQLIKSEEIQQPCRSPTAMLTYIFLLIFLITHIVFCIFVLPDCWGWVLWIHGAIGSPLVPWKSSVCLCWPLYNCRALHKNMSVLRTHTHHILSITMTVFLIQKQANVHHRCMFLHYYICFSVCALVYCSLYLSSLLSHCFFFQRPPATQQLPKLHTFTMGAAQSSRV